MKKIMVMMAVLLAAMTGFSEAAKPGKPAKQRLTPEERAERRRLAMERTGGLIEKKGIGSIAIVNCQSVIGKEAIEEALEGFKRVVHVEIRVMQGAFAMGEARIPDGSNLAVFIVDDPTLPMSLIAMEERWGMMNVSQLKSDAGKLPTRFKKQFVRVSSIALGGYVSQFKGSPLQPVKEVKDLDSIVADGYTFDVLTGVNRALTEFGVTPLKRTTYKKACEEGWAPAPTNEFQKAIWDRTHTPPKTPMTIEFDPKKGK